MSNVTGVFQGLIAGKTGTGKRGPWTLYSVQVDGKKYSCGFDPVKAATGDTVSFESATNERGYEEMDPKTFKVVAAATPASQAAAKASSPAAVQENNSISIESQVGVKEAGAIVRAFIAAGVPGVTLDNAGIITAKIAGPIIGAMAGATKTVLPAVNAPPKRVEPEDENQDDSLPY